MLTPGLFPLKPGTKAPVAGIDAKARDQGASGQYPVSGCSELMRAVVGNKQWSRRQQDCNTVATYDQYIHQHVCMCLEYVKEVGG